MISTSRIYYAVLISLASIVAVFYIMKITPIADDYSYASLILKYGLFGGVEDLLVNWNGLIFKEFIVLLLSIPIAFLPIGIGSGVSYLLVASLFVSAIVFILKYLAKTFWSTLALKDKALLVMVIGLIYFTSNAVLFRYSTLLSIQVSNYQSYDFTFWLTMQAYYIGTTAIFIAWFIFIQNTIKTKKYKILNIILFGLAMGTTNYTISSITVASIILWTIIYKIKPSLVFSFKIEKPLLYVASLASGIGISFLFPSTTARGEDMLSDRKGDDLENLLYVFGEASKHYLSSLTNPSLIIAMFVMAIIASVLFKNMADEAGKILKIGIIVLIISLISATVAAAIDSRIIFLPWHYTHAIMFIKISAIIVGLGLGLKFSKYVNTSSKKTAVSLLLAMLIITPISASALTIQDRFDCWQVQSCRIGHAEDIESEWVHEAWLTLQKQLQLPDRIIK